MAISRCVVHLAIVNGDLGTNHASGSVFFLLAGSAPGLDARTFIQRLLRRDPSRWVEVLR